MSNSVDPDETAHEPIIIACGSLRVNKQHPALEKVEKNKTKKKKTKKQNKTKQNKTKQKKQKKIKTTQTQR